MTTLQRAVALTEEDPIAVSVHDDLGFDVAGELEVFLDVDLGILEIGVGLAPSGFEPVRQLALLAYDPQAFAPSTVRCLDGYRVAKLRCRRSDRRRRT